MKAATRDIALSVAAMVILVGILAVSDRRVRDEFSGVGTASVSAHARSYSARVVDGGVTIIDVASDHPAMAVFVVAGTVLFACMFRT